MAAVELLGQPAALEVAKRREDAGNVIARGLERDVANDQLGRRAIPLGLLGCLAGPAGSRLHTAQLQGELVLVEHGALQRLDDCLGDVLAGLAVGALLACDARAAQRAARCGDRAVKVLLQVGVRRRPCKPSSSPSSAAAAASTAAAASARPAAVRAPAVVAAAAGAAAMGALRGCSGAGPENTSLGAHSRYSGTCWYFLYAIARNAARASPGSANSTTASVRLVLVRRVRQVLDEQRDRRARHAACGRGFARCRGRRLERRNVDAGVGERMLRLRHDLRLAECHAHRQVGRRRVEQLGLGHAVVRCDGGGDGVGAHEQRVPHAAVAGVSLALRLACRLEQPAAVAAAAAAIATAAIATAAAAADAVVGHRRCSVRGSWQRAPGWRPLCRKDVQQAALEDGHVELARRAHRVLWDSE
eukprot:365345-Chlamydomonas_euryale.AAC.4